jgi:hypothetical protein
MPAHGGVVVIGHHAANHVMFHFTVGTDKIAAIDPCPRSHQLARIDLVLIEP